ncbi:MAG TPA: response regulator transcription factor [Actinomycetales bacterium]|nr:response regulator transcription factor [Actinomycetales bacterium]
MRALVVEDDPRMARVLTRALVREGYAVGQAATGTEALELGLHEPFDVIVLDVMIPAPDGFMVLGKLRDSGVDSPVLMLTALTGVEDRVAGLDWGADDYLTKPFALSELCARLRALTRRVPVPRSTVLTVGDLTLDPVRHTVSRCEEPVRLTAREYALLLHMMRHPGQTLSRAHLRQNVWDPAFEGDSNVVDVYVHYLREKIDRPFGRGSVQTVKGFGYRLVDDRPASG